MTIGVLTLPWDLKLPRGGQQGVVFALKQADGIRPFPIAGKTFSYVVRASPADTGTPLINVTTSATTQGQLVVDTTFSTIALSLLSAATSGLTPGVYYHGFWMNPGQTSAFNWFAGKFIVEPVSQP